MGTGAGTGTGAGGGVGFGTDVSVGVGSGFCFDGAEPKAKHCAEVINKDPESPTNTKVFLNMY